ncbi:MAG: hypothetical protein P4K83_06910 [Terracidiphilus sp.]|nr:hypothetical protein [Terracidiphilus sp.]
MKSVSRWSVAIAVVAVVASMAGVGCKKKSVDAFPKSNAVAGWEKTADTRVFAAKDLWQYVDGDAEQYVSAGVVTTATADYKYQGQLEAVVDVFTMNDAGGAAKVMGPSQTADAKSVQVGDAGAQLAQSVVFRKGVYFVRIVAYEARPDGPQALVALAKAVEAKL